MPSRLRGNSHSTRLPSMRLHSEGDIMIPPYLRSSLLAYWDSRNRNAVLLPLTNLVTNGDFALGTSGWAATYAALTSSAGVLSIKASGATSVAWASQNYSFVAGRKYYTTCLARVTNAFCGSIFIDTNSVHAATQSAPLQNIWYKMGGVFTASSGDNLIYPKHQYADAATANGKVMEVQYVSVLDLTALFGSGNEPTALEIDSILSYNFPATSWFNGTQSCVINPDGTIFLPDSSGKGEHLKYRNVNYTAASGPQNTLPPYEKMDGTDDYMRRALTTPIASGSPFSVSFYMRIPNVAASIVECVLKGATLPPIVLYTSGSTMSCQMYDGTNYGSSSVSIAGNNNKYIHIVCTYSEATKKTRVYANAVGGALSAALPGQVVASVGITFSISDAMTGYFASDLSDLCIFNKTLTDADVFALFQYSRNRYGV